MPRERRPALLIQDSFACHRSSDAGVTHYGCTRSRLKPSLVDLGHEARQGVVLRSAAVAEYEIEFYEDEHGDTPVLRWLREELSPRKRRALGTAMNRVLQVLGVGVCGTEFGRQLGKGLFEFRLRGADLAKVVPGSGAGDPTEAKMLLRVFCHAHGDMLILLLGGYDKGEDVSAKRQDAEIALARKRLKEWQHRQRRGSL
jgi:hypothetical protein